MTDHRPWFRSWPADVPRTPRALPEASLYSLLLGRRGQRRADRPATAFFGKRLSYRELAGQVERCAAILAGLGVGSGDRVGLMLPNCPQYIIAFYACVRMGADPGAGATRSTRRASSSTSSPTPGSRS